MKLKISIDSYLNYKIQGCGQLVYFNLDREGWDAKSLFNGRD